MSDRTFESPEQFAKWVFRENRAFFWEKFRGLQKGKSIPSPFRDVTRKRDLYSYIDSLVNALSSGDITDLIGREDYDRYKRAEAGNTMEEIFGIPLHVRDTLYRLVLEHVRAGEVDSDIALRALIAVSDMIDSTIKARTESILKARDEEIDFFHSIQEEIDAFPEELPATLDISDLLRKAIERYIFLVNAGSCAIFKRDQALGEYVNLASNFMYESIFGSDPLRIDRDLNSDIIKNGRPIVIDGYKRSLPAITSYMRRIKTKNLLILPLRVRRKCIGLVIISPSEENAKFTEAEVKLAARFTNRLAVSMENTFLYLSEQKKLREAMALSEVLRLVSAPLEADTLCSRLAHIAADFSGGRLSAVYMMMRKEGILSRIAYHGALGGLDPEKLIPRVVIPENMTEADYHSVFIRKEATSCNPGQSPFVHTEMSDRHRVKCVYVVPVVAKDYIIGSLVILYDINSQDVDQDEIKLITAIARQSGVALENSALYEDLEMSYFATVKALARAIEVQDPYTYGHSERVTEYATAIARKMGVSEHELRNIKFAAVLHDIGKIGIPERILNKRESLSQNEKFSITNHPLIGDSIIEPVEFLREAGKIMLHHHERYDGKGYPSGIKEEEIPLGSRILAVADAFEAMLSDRPYRKAMEVEEVLKELEENSGKQFDPEVVNVLISLILEGKILGPGFFREIQTRQKYGVDLDQDIQDIY